MHHAFNNVCGCDSVQYWWARSLSHPAGPDPCSETPARSRLEKWCWTWQRRPRPPTSSCHQQTHSSSTNHSTAHSALQPMDSHHASDPKPYQASWNNWNPSPSSTVLLFPIFFISTLNSNVCTDRESWRMQNQRCMCPALARWGSMNDFFWSLMKDLQNDARCVGKNWD